MLFKRENRLRLDLSELQDEIENLSGYLHSNLHVDVASKGNELLVDPDKLSSKELKRTVRKFLYHRHLNNMYWVDLKSDVIKVNKFEATKKQKKRKKEGTTPSMITHGW